MKLLQKISLGYFCILLFAASLNYIPGLTDTEGRVFGIFALDIFDDSLHVASALWALSAALYSQRSAKMFLVVFGQCKEFISVLRGDPVCLISLVGRVGPFMIFFRFEGQGPRQKVPLIVSFFSAAGVRWPA